VGDAKPEFQIAVAPSFMNGSPTFNTDFATYAAQLVKYYNKGGFNVGTSHFQSPSVDPIAWWGIFNEPNLNNLDPTAYTQLYNTVVPTMQAVDPSIKFVAVELGDTPGEAQNFLPTVVSNVTAQVDVMATLLFHLQSERHRPTSIQHGPRIRRGSASDLRPTH
jgi:hypothetical protein